VKKGAVELVSFPLKTVDYDGNPAAEAD